VSRAKTRAVTLRAFAAKIIGYADYLENIRAKSEAPGATEQDRAADRAACDEFHKDPGAHALLQRVEFEAELFEALEVFKARVRRAERFRSNEPFTRDDADPVYMALQAIVGALARAKF
jgi:hypothetical protein